VERFGTYLHPETFETSKPRNEIAFIGQSLPYYDSVRELTAAALSDYPSLPLAKASLSDFERVHSKDYLARLQSMANGEPIEDPPKRSAECTGLEYSLPGYCYSLGGMMQAVRLMREGQLDRTYCFGLPGHHAYPDWGHGYCLLNPQPAAARYAQEIGFAHPLIIDWDLHHGDGTQAIFDGDNSVHCISIHSAIDLYMSMMRVHEAGTTTAAEKAGHQNIPLLSTIFPHDFWEQAGLPGRYYRYDEAIEAFERALGNVPWTPPDIVFIFSGYDAHAEDCGADTHKWREDDFRTLTRMVCRFADSLGAPILSVHGGGYDPKVAVRSAIAHVGELFSGYADR
jgi:acetoin utilization deacetylase AcuC-like enzyme